MCLKKSTREMVSTRGSLWRINDEKKNSTEIGIVLAMIEAIDGKIIPVVDCTCRVRKYMMMRFNK